MFSTELFECHQRSKKALVASLAEMYVQGVSTPQGRLQSSAMLEAVAVPLRGHDQPIDTCQWQVWSAAYSGRKSPERPV
jgi:hypothetical protein